MFNKKCKIVEIKSNGVTVTHFLRGKKQDVQKDIEQFKSNSRKYEVIGKDGMIVWA